MTSQKKEEEFHPEYLIFILGFIFVLVSIILTLVILCEKRQGFFILFPVIQALIGGILFTALTLKTRLFTGT